MIPQCRFNYGTINEVELVHSHINIRIGQETSFKATNKHHQLTLDDITKALELQRGYTNEKLFLHELSYESFYVNFTFVS